MHSTHPIYSRNIPLVCFLFLAWFVYLSTLSPTIFYRDTPELVDTAFTLGISHPEGFPIYNLMAKAVTFFPMGSIPFKVNLFSSLMGCLAILALYITSVAFLRVMAGPEGFGEPLLANGVSQLLSSRVTLFVSFGGLPGIIIPEESKRKTLNYLKNNGSLLFRGCL